MLIKRIIIENSNNNEIIPKSTIKCNKCNHIDIAYFDIEVEKEKNENDYKICNTKCVKCAEICKPEISTLPK